MVTGFEAVAPVHMDIALPPVAVARPGCHRYKLFIEKKLAHYARSSWWGIDDRDVENPLLDLVHQAVAHINMSATA